MTDQDALDSGFILIPGDCPARRLLRTK